MREVRKRRGRKQRRTGEAGGVDWRKWLWEAGSEEVRMEQGDVFVDQLVMPSLCALCLTFSVHVMK